MLLLNLVNVLATLLQSCNQHQEKSQHQQKDRDLQRTESSQHLGCKELWVEFQFGSICFWIHEVNLLGPLGCFTVYLQSGWSSNQIVIN